MNAKFFHALFLALFALPLMSQTDFEFALTRHKSSKIVLLGEWGAEDKGNWRSLLDSDGIYEHGFILIDSANISYGPISFAGGGINFASFER